jgi:hypothetical protein
MLPVHGFPASIFVTLLAMLTLRHFRLILFIMAMITVNHMRRHVAMQDT